MDLPFISDPFFYVVSVPAVLLLGISKSGFGAGLGSLAVPVMALAITVPKAAAILMPVLFVMDVLGMAAYKNTVDRRLLAFMVPFSLLGIVMGTFLFKLMNPSLVSGLVGGFTLLFLAQRLLFPPKPGSAPPPRWLGAILLTMSGFTSFIAHAGGPPVNAYVIPLKLQPMVFTGTMAFLFFFVNMAKWVPYAWLGLLDWQNFATSLVLLPLAPLGVWMGVRVAQRIEPVTFYRFVYGGMFLTGCKLLWDSLHG